MTCNVYLLCKYYHLRSWDRLKILFFSLDVLLFLLNKHGFKFEKNTKIKFPCQKKKKLNFVLYSKIASTQNFNTRV